MKKKETPGTFNAEVYQLLKKVPPGRVTTYGALAQALGRPKASRAVGNALHANPCAPQVPCHRVVRSDGALGGYVAGPRRKIELLRQEGVVVRQGRVESFATHFYDLN